MKKSLLIFVLSVVATFVAMAQVTTSALSGLVTDADGAVLGATVQAIHTPSGTRYGTVTNEKGTFAIQGMRVGGPYEVIVSYVGAETRKFEDIQLVLGETFNINVKLAENAEVLGDVVIIGQGSKFAATVKTGASTNISNQQMISLPTVSRSITDVARLSPYGGNGMTFSGTDGRTSNFTVDGANFNNNFGLNTGLPGGGNPISIDAIEEMQVAISPFDVRQTGFIGGGINAITKSGTNTYKGTAYIYHQNENMQGDAVEREAIDGMRAKDQKTTYGFTLGGPIIKNKLFFFANAEFVKKPTIANRWRGSDIDVKSAVAGQANMGVADEGNYISRTSKYDLQQVSDYVKSKYGYNTGSYNNFPADEDNTKFLARLDWNINDNHHLAFRWNYTLNNYWTNPSGTSMDGGTQAASKRVSKAGMSYANSLYATQNKVNSFSLDLNSRFSDHLSNQLLVTFSKLDDVRDSDSGDFPFIDILDGNGDNYISLGYELFTWNNAVHNSIWNLKDEINYYLGNHKIMGGVSYEHQMADNMYMRNGSGYFRYRSLEDFLSDAAPEIYDITYGYNGETEPAARVQYNKVGLYGQDNWNVNSQLNITAGLRIDGVFFDNGDLMTNNAIKELDYGGRSVDTGKWPKNSIAFSPRVGVTYDIFDDKSLVVRGGTGLFQGRLPLVFFTNMPTNSGMVQYACNVNASNLDKLNKSNGTNYSMDYFKMSNMLAGGSAPAAQLEKLLATGLYPANITPAEGSKPSSINGVDSDFKMPQVWKTSIALDYRMPVEFPWSFTAEAIFNKTINGVTIKDWSIQDAGSFARINGVDNRPIYPEDFRKGVKAFVLENTSKGYGIQSSLTMNVKPTENIDFMVAYTHSLFKELTSMPGSNAESAFTYVPTVEGPNNIRFHNAYNNTPDRLVASLNIHDKSNNHYSFIYETYRGGYNYSYMMVNDMNGDGYNYDALYIPTDDEVANGQMRFKSQADADRFLAYVHKDDYLSKHQGEYAEAYSVYSPFVHRLDFSYKHDFKLNIANTKHKLQVGFDIKNLLNLFNSSWGVAKIMNTDYVASGAARILKYEGVDKDGFATFSTPKSISGDTQIWGRNHAAGQCWYMSIGAKYFFN